MDAKSTCYSRDSSDNCTVMIKKYTRGNKGEKKAKAKNWTVDGWANVLMLNCSMLVFLLQAISMCMVYGAWCMHHELDA